MSNGLRMLAIIAALAAPSIALAQTCPPGSVARGGACVTAPAAGSTAGTVAGTPAPATTPPATASATTPPAYGSTAGAAAGASAPSSSLPAGSSTATPPVSGSSTPPADQNKTCAAGLMLYKGGCYPVH